MWCPSPKLWLSQYFIGYFFSYGVYVPFWALWLKGIGISAPDIGMLLGLGFAMRCVSNLIFPPKINKMTQLIPALRLVTFLIIIFSLAYFWTTKSFAALVVVTVLFNAMLGPAIPISDSLGNYYAKIKQLDYGRTRLWGSLSFIVGSAVTGLIADRLGYVSIPYVMLAGFIVTLVAILRKPAVLPADETDKEVVKVRLLPLLKNKNVLCFLVVTTLIQGSHAGYYNFSTLYWSEAGFSQSTISYLWGLGVVGEVFLFAVAKRLFAGWGINQMIRLSVFGVLIRWSVLAVTTDPVLLGMVQLLHGVTFGCTHLAAIRYIQDAGSNYMVALQSLYNAISTSAFVAIMSVVCGWIYSIQPNCVFWLMAAMGLPVLFIRLEKLTLK